MFVEFFPIGFSRQKFKVVYKNYDFVNYEILNPDGRSGHIGVVEKYSNGAVFRLETGDEMPLEEVVDRLWPVGGNIGPGST